MRPSRFLPTLAIAASLPFCGCSGCDRGSEAPAPPTATTIARGTAVVPTTSTSSTTPEVVARNGRYALFRPTKAKVGDAMTIEQNATTTGKVTKVGGDGPAAKVADVLDVLHAKWVETVSEVDADGHPTRYAVRVPVWSRRRDKQRDQSLVGAVLDVTGSGAARRWTLVEKPSEPTEEARQWLDEHFGGRGASDQDWLRIVLPDETVAIGETWTPSPDRLAAAMTATGMAVDRRRLSTSATFDGISQGLGNVSFKGDFALSKVPNSEAEWTSGGTLAFEGVMGVTLEPAPLALRTLNRKGTLAGEATVDDVPLAYDFAIDETRTATPGDSSGRP